MKSYENCYKQFLPRNSAVIIRVDLRAAHTLLKQANKPFDADFLKCMSGTMQALCEEMDGCVFGYQQSDEISLLLEDYHSTVTEPMFGNSLQKLVSISASIASFVFNRDRESYRELGSNWAASSALALFDSRAFVLPNAVEVGNYFLWRQRDAVRNSINMVAQASFSYKALQGLNTDQVQEKLWQEKNINWSNYDPALKRGQVCTKQTGEWQVEGAPEFEVKNGSWLALIVPQFPAIYPAVLL